MWAASDRVVNGALPTVTESWRYCYDGITTDEIWMETRRVHCGAAVVRSGSVSQLTPNANCITAVYDGDRRDINIRVVDGDIYLLE